jgi:hypothetical protein
MSRAFSPTTLLRMAALLACATILVPAQAADKPLTAQQQRMKSCNSEASGQQLKGDARRQFMSQCLKGESSGPERTAQQEKMATCNREATAKHMKGDDRRSFMSRCLRGSPAAAGR